MERESKREIIEEELIEMMRKGKLSASGQLPSLNELAVKHGVSRPAVRQAFLNLKERGFIDIVPGKGAFAKDHSTVKRKLVRNNCISIIVPNMAGSFMLEVVAGAEKELSKRDCYLSIFNSLNDFKVERENIKKAIEVDSKGILLFPVTNVYPFNPNYDIYIETQKQDIPLIFIDNYPLNLDVDYVVADDYQGLYDLTTYAIEMGHTKIAYFGGPTHISTLANRYHGYWQAMADAGLHIDTRLVFPNEQTLVKEGYLSTTQFAAHTGADYLRAILSGSDRPSVVLFSDVIAEYLEKVKEFHIPDELGIGCRGFHVEREDISTPYVLGRYANAEDSLVDVTHCVLYPSVLGEKAAEVILDKLEREKGKDKVRLEIDMPLHKGNSIKKIGRSTHSKGKVLAKR